MGEDVSPRAAEGMVDALVVAYRGGASVPEIAERAHLDAQMVRDALRMRGLLGAEDIGALLAKGWTKTRVAGHLGVRPHNVTRMLERATQEKEGGPRCAHCDILLGKGEGWAVVVDGEDERGRDVRHPYCRDCVEQLGLWVESWREA